MVVDVGRQSEYIKRPFESVGDINGIKDTSANIYYSMLLSEAWRSLTPKQQMLYIYCRAQEFADSKKPTTAEYPNGNERLFTMNRAKYVMWYRLYKDNNRTAFQRDMEALILKGFIRCAEERNCAKTVYQYSSLWQHFGTNKFKLTNDDMTSALRKKLCR